jgi:hypothetical protein
MCIRRETREKARRSLAFSRVSKPHKHITHMLRQCTSIVYILYLLLSNNIGPGRQSNIIFDIFIYFPYALIRRKLWDTDKCIKYMYINLRFAFRHIILKMKWESWDIL